MAAGQPAVSTPLKPILRRDSSSTITPLSTRSVSFEDLWEPEDLAVLIQNEFKARGLRAAFEFAKGKGKKGFLALKGLKGAGKGGVGASGKGPGLELAVKPPSPPPILRRSGARESLQSQQSLQPEVDEEDMMSELEIFLEEGRILRENSFWAQPQKAITASVGGYLEEVMEQGAGAGPGKEEHKKEKNRDHESGAADAEKSEKKKKKKNAEATEEPERAAETEKSEKKKKNAEAPEEPERAAETEKSEKKKKKAEASQEPESAAETEKSEKKKKKKAEVLEEPEKTENTDAAVAAETEQSEKKKKKKKKGETSEEPEKTENENKDAGTAAETQKSEKKKKREAFEEPEEADKSEDRASCANEETEKRNNKKKRDPECKGSGIGGQEPAEPEKSSKKKKTEQEEEEAKGKKRKDQACVETEQMEATESKKTKTECEESVRPAPVRKAEAEPRWTAEDWEAWWGEQAGWGRSEKVLPSTKQSKNNIAESLRVNHDPMQRQLDSLKNFVWWPTKRSPQFRASEHTERKLSQRTLQSMWQPTKPSLQEEVDEATPEETEERPALWGPKLLRANALTHYRYIIRVAYSCVRGLDLTHPSRSTAQWPKLFCFYPFIPFFIRQVSTPNEDGEGGAEVILSGLAHKDDHGRLRRALTPGIIHAFVT